MVSLKKGLNPVVLCALGLVALPMPASAIVITGTDTDFSWDFERLSFGVTISGSVAMDVTAFDTTNNFIDMLVTLTNTTPIATDGINRWMSWGFGVSPDVTSAVFTDGNDGNMVAINPVSPDNQLPGLVMIEWCVRSVAMCQSGGPPTQGLNETESDAFSLRLNFADLLSSGASFDPFGARYISIGAPEESDTFYIPPPPPPPVTVSEPASLMLLGLGLLGIAAAPRLRRKIT